MIGFLGGRLLQTVPVLFGVSLIVFFLVRLIPGDPAIAALGSRTMPQLIARVHDQLGLDMPVWRQYLNSLGRSAHGAFGISFFYQANVWSITVERLPVTLALLGYSTLLSVLIATPYAFLAAIGAVAGYTASSIVETAPRIGGPAADEAHEIWRPSRASTVCRVRRLLEHPSETQSIPAERQPHDAVFQVRSYDVRSHHNRNRQPP